MSDYQLKIINGKIRLVPIFWDLKKLKEDYFNLPKPKKERNKYDD